MIRVLATSGSEVEALAVIRAVQALASALRINRALTQLLLHGNDVGVQGVQAHKIASNTSQVPGLRCFKHAVACQNNLMPKLPGAGFSTDGKQSGCS